jgi:hypothetical protein
MRTLLRRRLQEVEADNWQDTDLNDLLNLGLHEVQKRIVSVDPFAFLWIDTTHLVQGQSLYKKPVGFWYEYELNLLDTTANPPRYTRMVRNDYEALRDAGTGNAAQYAHAGQYFFIAPAPEAAVASGLQILWMPSLEMAVDSDVPDIHFAMHNAVVVATQLITFGETGVAREAIAAEYEGLANPEVIARYYHRSAADLDQIKIDTGKVIY